MAGPRPMGIRVEWAEENKAAGVPAFNTGPLSLVAPHLQREVTDVRLACIWGIAPGDFDLYGPSGELVPFEASARYRRFKGLEVGRTYKLLLRHHAIQELRTTRRYVPYRYLGGDGHLAAAQLERMSSRFYSRVWATRHPASFKASFEESAGTAERAATNQAVWLARYFGVGGGFSSSPGQKLPAGRSSAADREDGDTLALTQREGRLVAQLTPKHPDRVMRLDHALAWLQHMTLSVKETIPDALPAHSVRLFLLHFLAFFDFTPDELVTMRVAAMAPVAGPGAACL